MKLFAYTGIAAALTMATADVILLGQPVSGSYYDISSFGAVEHVSAARASVGSLLGLTASFFICIGFWHFKKLFNPVSNTLSTALFIALCSVMFFGGAFHAGYYFIAPTTTAPLLPAMRQNFIQHLEIISGLGIPGFIIGSILFFKLALDNMFPKWFRYANPLIISSLVLGILYVLPAPVGGYIRPAFLNLATALFFSISLLVPFKQNPKP